MYLGAKWLSKAKTEWFGSNLWLGKVNHHNAAPDIRVLTMALSTPSWPACNRIKIINKDAPKFFVLGLSSSNNLRDFACNKVKRTMSSNKQAIVTEVKRGSCKTNKSTTTTAAKVIWPNTAELKLPAE